MSEQEPIIEDREKLIRAELETLSEEELKERLKKPLPKWSYLLPVLFSIIGGIAGWVIFSNRRGSGNLIIVGLIVSGVNIILNIAFGVFG